jgi:hypothetical protein
VYILLVTPGTYELNYKRENIVVDLDWRRKFNIRITIICGSIVYVLYFIIFEGKNCCNRFRAKLGHNDNKVGFQEGAE